MNPKQQQETQKKYVCYAPSPTDPSIMPSIYCVELEEDLDVEWQWTCLPDGNRVVTDYKLVPKEN
jgi:hypothetical protein